MMKIEKVKEKNSKEYLRKIAEIKKKIRQEIEDGFLQFNPTEVFSESEISSAVFDKLMIFHNEFEAEKDNTDIFKLFHEVFCSLFCAYLQFNDSYAVRYSAHYERKPCSNDFIDYIGFKW